MKSLLLLEKELRKHAISERARVSMRYFKTGKGEYGEGEQFLGVAVPIQRSLAAKYANQVTEADISDLLSSPYHEIRLTALFMLNTRFLKSADQAEAKNWVNFYLSHVHCINNWDLVDSSAPIVLGKWLQNRNRRILYQFAQSKNLWKNRIAMLTTLAFIRNNELDDLLKLAEIFISHPHDLMHKATGWMLREGWKRDSKVIEAFLSKFKSQMPRTMLRYAIEKMSPAKKNYYMK
jgi:3-methyladenine DNA glycosylase AlkD